MKLVVTGDLEKRALKKSLERCFSETSDGVKVEFLDPRRVQCITTNPLRPVSHDDANVPTNIDAMARAMIAEIWPGVRGEPVDLVVAVDDLELANQPHPDRVVQWVRRGVERVIARSAENLGAESADKLRVRVRERCSFHLLAPMVEAYFFAEDAALRRAGVSSAIEPRLLRRDVEDFETNDPLYLPNVRSQNEQRHAMGYTWWRHERHPKHYLEHLCVRSGGLYGETTEGRRALEELRWASLAVDQTSLTFARALFQDLADAFGVDNPMGAGERAPL